MAPAGSCAGTGGISTRPAPRLPRDDPSVLAWVPRMPVVVLVTAEPGIGPWFWLVAVAKADAAARPHTVQYPPSMVPPQPGCVQVAGQAGLVEGGTGAGVSARPHMVQYPPSMVPQQPGRVHCAAVVVIAAASPRSAPGSPPDSSSPQLRRLPGRTALSTAGHGP